MIDEDKSNRLGMDEGLSLEEKRKSLRKQVANKYVFWSCIALTLCSWIYMGASLIGSRANTSNVEATVAALSEEGVKFTDESIAEINLLQPTTRGSSVLFAVDYDNKMRSAECQGSIIDMKQTSEGSRILFVTASHCLPDGYNPERANIATFNDVVNTDVDNVNQVGTPLIIERVLPLGDKSVGIIFNCDINYDDLWKHGFWAVGKDKFLAEPSLEEHKMIEALMYIGPDYMPTAVWTDYSYLFGTAFTQVSGHPGTSGLNFFTSDEGAWVGTLQTHVDATMSTLVNVPSQGEKEQMFASWEEVK